MWKLRIVVSVVSAAPSSDDVKNTRSYTSTPNVSLLHCADLSIGTGLHFAFILKQLRHVYVQKMRNSGYFGKGDGKIMDSLERRIPYTTQEHMNLSERQNWLFSAYLSAFYQMDAFEASRNKTVISLEL